MLSSLFLASLANASDTLPASFALDSVSPRDLRALDGVAQDEEEEEEEEEPGERRQSAGQIREVVRGFYLKANAGSALYLLQFSDWVKPGTFVSLAVGQDFVDNENQSMAWEVSLQQGLHNGEDYLTQASFGCMAAGGGAACTQGDLRTYTLAANYEISFYPSRRVGIGARVGGGVMMSPLLVNAEAWQTDVLPEYGLDPGHHSGVKPVVFGGPTLEYYTKLAHFSVGLDVDVTYTIGWDLGLNATGAFKYTF
jgi:hypothetical protein